MKKCKPIDHRFESDGGPCLKRRIIAQKKAEKTRTKSISKNNDHSANALGDCGSISEWEQSHGRGFWGCAAHGYTYDKDNK